MTELEYRNLAAFKHLPLLSELDQDCDSVDRGRDKTGIFTGEVFEAETLDGALSYISRQDLEPKGAIEFQGGNGPSIRVYFWRLR